MKTFLIVAAMGLLVGGTAWAVSLSQSSSAPVVTASQVQADSTATGFSADDCCRYIVKGCDKEAKVCVAGSCNSDNEHKARNAFEKANSCNSSNVSSYIGTCSGEKCDIDLR